MAESAPSVPEELESSPRVGPLESLYAGELEAVEKYDALLAGGVSEKELAGEFPALFQLYRRLLRQTMKMTALSDAAQLQMMRTSRELSRAMADLTRVNEHLGRLNEEKDEILALASHDMRTPLSGIVGLSDILLESPSLSAAESQDFLKSIRSSAEDLCDMINDLLDIYRVESADQDIRIGESSLQQILEQIEEEHRLAARAKEVTLVIEQLGADRVVRLDKPLFLRVVNNLVGNAIRFTPAGKKVTIRLGLTDSFIGLEVADEGPGIPEEERQNILSGKARLRVRPASRTGSAGVGLLIVKRILDKRNGILQCEGVEGKGSVFSVQFPLAA